MKNHIDITFDLETCARTPNAAVMQAAAVAWCRDEESDPFSLFLDKNAVFNEYIDLRTCVVDGFDFDQQTVNWWSLQSEETKKAVCSGLAESTKEVFYRFNLWIKDVVKIADAQSACLWCQGMDFDGSILRNICHKYDLELPLKYQQFRDCRTIIIEAAAIKARNSMDAKSEEKILLDPSKAYDFYDPMPDDYIPGKSVHDALYDALRSSWNTWQALKWLKNL